MIGLTISETEILTSSGRSLCACRIYATIGPMTKKIIALVILSGLVAAGSPAQKKKLKGPEKDAQYEYEKAVISMKYGLEDESVKYLNQAIAMDPKHADSYKLLGVHLTSADAPFVDDSEVAAEVRGIAGGDFDISDVGGNNGEIGYFFCAEIIAEDKLA